MEARDLRFRSLAGEIKSPLRPVCACRSASVWDWRRCRVSLRLRQWRITLYVYLCMYGVCVCVCTHVHMYGEPRSRRLLYLIDDLSRCLLSAERYPSARHEEATWDRLIKSFRVASEVVGFIWQRCRTIACPIPVIILLFSPPSSRPVSFSRVRSFVYGKCARRLDLVCSKNKTLDKRFVVSSSTGRENFFPSLRILSASCSEKRW